MCRRREGSLTRRVLSSVALAVTFVVAAVVAVSAHADRSGRVPVRECDSRAEGGAPVKSLTRPGDVRIGPVAFFGLARLAARSELERFRSGTVYTVKTPAFVRAGRVVVVRVAPRAQKLASLSFAPGSNLGSVAGGAPAVRFEACPRSEPAFSYRGTVGPVTAFAGGFIVAQPACVPLDISVAGRVSHLRRVVSFGSGRC